MIVRAILYVGIIFLYLSCSDEKVEVPTSIPEVTVSEDPAEGGTIVDIGLSIARTEKNNFATVYHILSSFKSKQIGFLLRIPNQTLDSTGYGIGMRFSSAGEKSNNFLSFLFDTYNPNYGLDSLGKYEFASVTSFPYHNYRLSDSDSSQSYYVTLDDSPYPTLILNIDTVHKKLKFTNYKEPSAILKKLSATATN